MPESHHDYAVGTPIKPRDAINVLLESDRIVANLIQVCVFDTTSSERAPLQPGEARSFFADQVASSPWFNRRLYRYPLDLGDPYWEVGGVDAAENIYVTPLREPGWAPLEKEVVRLLNTRLDLRKSTWQIHVLPNLRGIAGLPDECCAVVVKLHHAATDGLGLTEVVRSLFGGGGESMSRLGSEHVEKVPPLSNAARRLPSAMAKFAWDLRAVRSANGPAGKITYAANRFNGNAALNQSLKVAWFDLAEVRGIKTAVPEATVNDIMLSVISCAMSRFLADVGEPTTELGATIPIDIRDIRDTGAANQTVFANVNLHSDVNDPLARLTRIHESTVKAKYAAREKATVDAPRPFEEIPPPATKLIGALSACGRKTARRRRVAAHTAVSNIPHGPADLFFGDAPAVAMFRPMPTVDGMGIIHHITSLGNRIALAVTAELDMLDDPDGYAVLLQHAFKDLEYAARQASV